MAPTSTIPRDPRGPCLMCKGNESIRKGFDGASVVKHLLVGFAQGLEPEIVVTLLCERHRHQYERTLEDTRTG